MLFICRDLPLPHFSVTESLVHYVLPDGVSLCASAYGDAADPPVILAHGGGQTRYSWGSTAHRLAEHGWYATAYDHRGHGDSDWDPQAKYDLPQFAADLRHVASRQAAKPVIVGASLGGLSAMLAGGESDQDLFRAIVLVDIVPRMNVDGAKDIIGFMSERIDEGFGSLEEAAQVIADYTKRPKRSNVEGLRKNLRLGEDGRYHWHWDPQFALQRANSDNLGLPDQMEQAVKQLEIPILLVRGARSNLVTEQLAQDFLQTVPHAEYVDVDNAHHMVAGDRNDIFSTAVVDFITRL